MSVTMTKGEGVTVFTVTSNPKSAWPPLCQLFGALCYSPMCCSVSRGLKAIPLSFSALAVIHIMVGLLTLSIGGVRFSSSLSWEMRDNATPFWSGGVILVLGFVYILTDKYPSYCLVVINTVMALVGVGIAITAIVFYAIDLASMRGNYYWLCRKEERYYRRWGYDTTTAPNPAENILQESYFQKCREGKEMLVMLSGGLDIVLIIMGALGLCVTISIAVLKIKALCHHKVVESQGSDDPEPYQPLVGEANTTASA